MGICTLFWPLFLSLLTQTLNNEHRIIGVALKTAQFLALSQLWQGHDSNQPVS